MANVVLRDVRKTYPGGVDAIKGVSFEVADGALCVLVGPSGCGKSTLLRMVAGLETITGGAIDIASSAGRTTLMLWLPLETTGALEEMQ